MKKKLKKMVKEKKEIKRRKKAITRSNRQRVTNKNWPCKTRVTYLKKKEKKILQIDGGRENGEKSPTSKYQDINMNK